MRYFLLGIFLIPLTVSGQDSGQLSLNAYFDAYYGTYTDDLPLNEFQKFTTVSPRDNQIGINAAQLGLAYTNDWVRGVFTIHYGDIAKATWDPDFQAVQAAWAGIKVLENVWVDAGFFPTHVGTESFLPKNNMLSSTTVATYIGPFYQGGARVSWTGSERLSASFHVVNGYNQFLDRNRAKSYGILVSYQFNEDLTLSYVNLLGRESEEDAPLDQYLVYQNLFGTWEKGRVKVIAGGDVAFQSNSALDDPEEQATMINFLTTVRYSFSETFSATGRFEWYNDPEGFLSGSFTGQEGEQGLVMTGYTAGVEYAPTSSSFLRMETRYLQNEKGLNIYQDNEVPTDNRWEFMITLGVFLDEWVLVRHP